jgi:hypothetical protein
VTRTPLDRISHPSGRPTTTATMPASCWPPCKSASCRAQSSATSTAAKEEQPT